MSGLPSLELTGPCLYLITTVQSFWKLLTDCKACPVLKKRKKGEKGPTDTARPLYDLVAAFLKPSGRSRLPGLLLS